MVTNCLCEKFNVNSKRRMRVDIILERVVVSMEIYRL